jgi:hypothetical protein
MGRAAMHLSAMVVVTLGGCAIEWKVPEQSPDAGGAGPGGGGGTGGDGGAGGASPSSSSSSGAGGSGGAEDCDQGTSCGTCVGCALTGACEGLYQACMSDPDCQPIAQCVIVRCGESQPTSACSDACVTGHRAGEAQFDLLLACLACQVCGETCDEIASWACPAS